MDQVISSRSKLQQEQSSKFRKTVLIPVQRVNAQKMAKIAILLLALVAVAAANPLGGAVVTKNHHVTSSVVSPYLGLGMGYGMLGYPGIGMGHHTVSSHSAVAHHGYGLGYGMMG